MEKNHIEICCGCSKVIKFENTGWGCKVYADPSKTYGFRMGQCAFNMKSVMAERRKVRVGQQKQRKRF